jgi:transmembrane sensor
MTSDESRDRALEAAMDWALRVNAAPGDQSLRRQLEDWRTADPTHAKAWTQAQQTWGLIADIPPAHASEWSKARRMVRRPRRTLMWVSGASALALAACLMLLFVPILAGFRGDHATAVAEIRNVTLEDGSVVTLAPRSALDVRFGSTQRSLSLLEGEAFFEVAADSQRPFVVNAAGVHVAAVGTAFDIRISSASVIISVRNGLVDVQAGAGSAAGGVRLSPGDRVKVDRGNWQYEHGKTTAEEIASWRDRRVFFDGVTVAEVAEELGRYRSGWIVVSDPQLAAQRVTGLFMLDDTDRALAALVEPFNGRVRSITPLLQVLSLP